MSGIAGLKRLARLREMEAEAAEAAAIHALQLVRSLEDAAETQRRRIAQVAMQQSRPSENDEQDGWMFGMCEMELAKLALQIDLAKLPAVRDRSASATATMREARRSSLQCDHLLSRAVEQRRFALEKVETRSAEDRFLAVRSWRLRNKSNADS